ncbi:hypothetical protein J6590_079935 [Homalodisca vitripennis]|nr:hypothetical protein J6590_079935 [Homalodisca vitripennis]
MFKPQYRVSPVLRRFCELCWQIERSSQLILETCDDQRGCTSTDSVREVLQSGCLTCLCRRRFGYLKFVDD